MSRPTTKVGNLTRDPEVRFSASGTAWCSVGMAVTPYDPKTKKRDNAHPQFYELVLFRKLAENVGDCLRRGDRVVVQGDGELEEYTVEETGEVKTRKKIVVTAIGPELRFATVSIHKQSNAKPEAATADEGGEFPDDF